MMGQHITRGSMTQQVSAWLTQAHKHTRVLLVLYDKSQGELMRPLPPAVQTCNGCQPPLSRTPLSPTIMTIGSITDLSY